MAVFLVAVLVSVIVVSATFVSAIFVPAIFVSAIFLFLIAAPYELEIARKFILSLDLCNLFLEQNVRGRFVLGWPRFRFPANLGASKNCSLRAKEARRGNRAATEFGVDRGEEDP
ncbi:MAG: hypothetical protein WAK27_07540 [Candidatus Sulfotelmatobacter sp.]